MVCPTVWTNTHLQSLLLQHHDHPSAASLVSIQTAIVPHSTCKRAQASHEARHEGERSVGELNVDAGSLWGRAWRRQRLARGTGLAVIVTTLSPAATEPSSSSVVPGCGTSWSMAGTMEKPRELPSLSRGENTTA